MALHRYIKASPINNQMTAAPTSQELTQSMLILQDLEKIAAALLTMYIDTPDDQVRCSSLHWPVWQRLAL